MADPSEQDPPPQPTPVPAVAQRPVKDAASPVASTEHAADKTAVPVAATSAAANGAPGLGESSKKKSRLQWDEDNLISNAIEMERAGPRLKIDEPKTPYVQGSETGSSTSGSAHQSPPESPSFIPGERLVGFHSLEASMRGSGGGASSDGASSAGSAGRSVQISDDFAHSSGGSSPRSKELFAAKRKAHYRNEAARLRKSVLMAAQLDNNEDEDADADDEGNDRANGHRENEETNGQASATSTPIRGARPRSRLTMLNGHRDDHTSPVDRADDDD